MSGIVGGIIAWFIKRETDKKGKKKEGKKKADELTKLVKLKEQGDYNGRRILAYEKQSNGEDVAEDFSQGL